MHALFHRRKGAIQRFLRKSRLARVARASPPLTGRARDVYAVYMTTKTRLLDSALEELERAGLEGFSLRSVGAAAGVTPMAVYRHFKNRDDLLAAVGEEAFADNLEAVAEDGFVSGVDGVGGGGDLLDLMAAVVQEQRGAVALGQLGQAKDGRLAALDFGMGVVGPAGAQTGALDAGHRILDLDFRWRAAPHAAYLGAAPPPAAHR
mgnify:CR=1 FL=1